MKNACIIQEAWVNLNLCQFLYPTTSTFLLLLLLYILLFQFYPLWLLLVPLFDTLQFSYSHYLLRPCYMFIPDFVVLHLQEIVVGDSEGGGSDGGLKLISVCSHPKYNTTDGSKTRVVWEDHVTYTLLHLNAGYCHWWYSSFHRA